jgi:hypothetical protein
VVLLSADQIKPGHCRQYAHWVDLICEVSLYYFLSRYFAASGEGPCFHK